MKKKSIITLMLILSALIVETPPMAKAGDSIDAQDIWVECQDNAYPDQWTGVNDGTESIESSIKGSLVYHNDLWGYESDWDFNITQLMVFIDGGDDDESGSVAVYEHDADDDPGDLFGQIDGTISSATTWNSYYPTSPIALPPGEQPRYFVTIWMGEEGGSWGIRRDDNPTNDGEMISRSIAYTGTYPDPLTGESCVTTADYWVRGFVTAFSETQTTFNQYYDVGNITEARRDVAGAFPSGVSDREIKVTLPKSEKLLNLTYNDRGEWNATLSGSDYTLDSNYNATHMLITIPEATISSYGDDYRVFTSSYDYGYDLYGLFYENGTFMGSVTITAVTASGPVEYNVDGHYHVATDNEIMFFFWDLSGGGTRRIYVTAPIETFYLFAPHDTYSSYSFEITDYIGAIGFQDSHLEMYGVVNSTTYLIERYLIWDSESTSPLTAMRNKIYELQIRLPTDNIYSFGYWVPTTATPPTLTLSILDPDDYYQPISGIVEIKATRPNATHIQVEYLDKMDLTLSVFVNITLRDETMVYNVTGGSSLEIFNWYDAVNTTEYVVSVTVSHTYYGEITYSTTLTGETDYDDTPSWSILGIEDQWVYLGLVVVVAGTVSMVNAAVGLFAGACVASALVSINLVEIPYELLAGAFIISILMGLTKK